MSVARASSSDERAQWLTPRFEAAAYAILGVVYLVSRLSLVWRLPWYPDETVFASYTLNGFEHVDARFQALANGQQPLLEWLGMAWMSIGLEPVTALRMVSLTACLIAFALVAFLGYRLGGHETALAAAGVFVIVPFTVPYGVVGLYDPLAAALVMAALVLQIELARRPNLGQALLLGIVLAGAVLTKLTANVALYLLPLSLLAFDWRPIERGRRLLAWIGAVGLSLLLAWLGSQVIQLSDLADDLSATRQILAKHSLSEGVSNLTYWIRENFSSYGWAFVAYLSLALTFAALVGAVVAVRRNALGLIVIGWVVLPFVALVLLAEFPAIRWLFIVAPPAVVLAGFGVVMIVRAAASMSVAWAIVAAAVLLVPATVHSAWILASPATAWYPARDGSDFTEGQAWANALERLRAFVGARQVSVALAGYGAQYPQLALRHDHNITLVDAATQDLSASLYALQTGPSLPVRQDGLSWREVARFHRLRSPLDTVLFQRGVTYNGAFATNADELRAAIGGSDADYDAFVAAHPAVKTWLEALQRAEQPQ